MFDDLSCTLIKEKTNTQIDFCKETTNKIFDSVIQMIQSNESRLDFLVPCYLDLTRDYLSNINDKSIANVILQNLRKFVQKNGATFKHEHWREVICGIQTLFAETLPTDLLRDKDYIDNSSSKEKIGQQ